MFLLFFAIFSFIINLFTSLFIFLNFLGLGLYLTFTSFYSLFFFNWFQFYLAMFERVIGLLIFDNFIVHLLFLFFLFQFFDGLILIKNLILFRRLIILSLQFSHHFILFISQLFLLLFGFCLLSDIFSHLLIIKLIEQVICKLLWFVFTVLVLGNDFHAFNIVSIMAYVQSCLTGFVPFK